MINNLEIMSFLYFLFFNLFILEREKDLIIRTLKINIHLDRLQKVKTIKIGES